jgi:hypothetical protein
VDTFDTSEDQQGKQWGRSRVRRVEERTEGGPAQTGPHCFRLWMLARKMETHAELWARKTWHELFFVQYWVLNTGFEHLRQAFCHGATPPSLWFCILLLR